MMQDLELLWSTHDFALEKIAVLEDEFSFLLNKLNILFETECSEAFENLSNSLGNMSYAMNLPPAEDNVSKFVLSKQFEEITKQLNLYYNKQINTIKELSDFYKANKYDIPAEREVSIEAFQELLEVTTHLRDVLNESYDSVKNMLDEI